jgi:hypothetical protein
MRSPLLWDQTIPEDKGNLGPPGCANMQGLASAGVGEDEHSSQRRTWSLVLGPVRSKKHRPDRVGYRSVSHGSLTAAMSAGSEGERHSHRCSWTRVGASHRQRIVGTDRITGTRGYITARRRLVRVPSDDFGCLRAPFRVSLANLFSRERSCIANRMTRKDSSIQQGAAQDRSGCRMRRHPRGEVAQIGDRVVTRSPGPLVASPGEPGSQHWFLGWLLGSPKRHKTAGPTVRRHQTTGHRRGRRDPIAHSARRPLLNHTAGSPLGPAGFTPKSPRWSLTAWHRAPEVVPAWPHPLDDCGRLGRHVAASRCMGSPRSLSKR